LTTELQPPEPEESGASIGSLNPVARGRQIAVVIAVAIVGPLVAIVAQLAISESFAPSAAFFNVCATVGPLPGLALFIDFAVVSNQLVGSQGLTPANRALARVLVYSNALLFITAEGLALYAVANGEETVFLTFGTLIPLVIQVYLLTEAALLKTRANAVRRG